MARVKTFQKIDFISIKYYNCEIEFLLFLQVTLSRYYHGTILIMLIGKLTKIWFYNFSILMKENKFFKLYKNSCYPIYKT